MAAVRGRHHRWLSVVAILLAVGALAAFSASRVVGYVFESRLAKMVGERSHARVEFGTVLYSPPYSFYASNVRVLNRRVDGSEVPAFTAGGMNLSLDHFPRGGEPVAVKSLVFRQATINYGSGARSALLNRIELSFHQAAEANAYEGDVHVSQGPAGFADAHARLDTSAGQLDVSRININARLAPLLAVLPIPQAGRPVISRSAVDAKVVVTGSATVPLGDPRHADYQLAVTLDDASVKIPRWRANLDHGGGRLLVRPSRTNAPDVEVAIESLQIASNKGWIGVDGGTATLRPGTRDWSLSEVVGTLQLGSSLPVFLPNSGWFFNEGQFGGPVRFTLAASGPFKVPAGQSPFEVIRHEFLAYPRDVSVRPRNFAAPIEHISGGPIAFRGGVVTLQNLTGTYGRDRLLLRSARLTLADPARRIALEDLRTQVKFEEIAGTVVFDRDSPPYPGVMGKTVAQLKPQGPFVVGGGSWYAINRPPRDAPDVKFKPDYFIRLSGDGGSFAVGKYNLPLERMEGGATIAPMSVDIAGFKAATLGGTAWAQGQIVPGRPFLYRGRIDAREVDVAQLAQVLQLDERARARLTGTGALSFTVSGTGRGGPKTPAQTFVADGEWEILHGDFWSVPAVRDVASRVRKPEDLGTGDAAGVVHIERETISLESAAINSPLLGLQGRGTIGFDKSLDLTVVAAPLGDWRDRMRQAGIPVVGDVLGAVQQLLNTAQGALLYQFRVTGSLSKPANALIPAPVITQPVAFLFGQMLRQDRKEPLLADVKRQAPPAAAGGEASPVAQPASARQPRSN